MAIIDFTASNGGKLSIEFNTEKHVTGAHIDLYAGGSDHRQATSRFETEPGYIILGFMPKINAKFGESGYSTSLFARDAHFETVEKVTETLEGLIKAASENDNGKNKDSIEWFRKYALDYYLKVTSANTHFEVTAYARSRQIKIPPGVVIDTKTARISMSFTFHVMKLITPHELELLDRFFKDAIATGSAIERSFREESAAVAGSEQASTSA